MRGSDDVVHPMDYSKYQLTEILNIIKRDNIYHTLASSANPSQTQTTHLYNQNKLLNYDGNFIRSGDRAILAAAGPNNHAELNTLLHHLLDNANPITQLIILITNEADQSKYCANYFLKNYPIQCEDYIIEKEITMINTLCTSSESEIDYQTQCICTNFTVTAKLNNRKNNLNVYSIPVPNGSSIVSPGSPKRERVCSDKNKPFINFLMHNYCAWLSKGILAVHCELGINRSAQLAMIYFLLADFEKIFVPLNPAQTVQNIEQKINMIMSQRLRFLPSLQQFLDAIDITLMMKVALEEYNLQNTVVQNPENISNSTSLIADMEKLLLWSDSNKHSPENEKDSRQNKENEVKCNISTPQFQN